MIQLPKFYPILDTETLARRGCEVVEAAEGLIEAGSKIIQFRHKGAFTRTVFDAAEIVAGLCRQAGATFVVNDRADVALMLGAGVHLGQEDLLLQDARGILGAASIIGFSTHNEKQFARGMAEPADYLAIGPVFATVSKLNPDPVLGLESLRTIVSGATKPVVAIGGITPERARQVWETGVQSVAVIGVLFTEPCNSKTIRERAESWLVL